MNKHPQSYKLALKGQTIEVRMLSTQRPEDISALRSQIVELSAGRRLDVLVDVSAIKAPDPATKEAAIGFFTDLPYRRYAVYGGSQLSLNLSVKSQVKAAADREHVKFFRREEDARKWLEEGRRTAKLKKTLKSALGKNKRSKTSPGKEPKNRL